MVKLLLQLIYITKKKLFEWEVATGIAKEAIGTGATHVTSVGAAVHSTKTTGPTHPAVTQNMIENAKASLKHHASPVATGIAVAG